MAALSVELVILVVARKLSYLDRLVNNLHRLVDEQPDLSQHPSGVPQQAPPGKRTRIQKQNEARIVRAALDVFSIHGYRGLQPGRRSHRRTVTVRPTEAAARCPTRFPILCQ